MKVSVLTMLFSVAACPLAAAAESAAECQLDEARREVQARAETATPAATAARPTVAQREAGEQPARPGAERRRNGRPIPDAELIGPRGAL
jgi:hypothetical protein